MSAAPTSGIAGPTGPQRLAEVVADALSAAGFEAAGDGRLPSFERPRNRDHGDWATNVALTLARPLRRPPREVAQAIVAHIRVPADVERVEVAGPGFINFTLSHGALELIVAEAVARGAEWGTSDEGAKRPINMEFVSANPTGPLHVGAGRWIAAGDAMANLLVATGWAVTREYYLNDVGNQLEVFGRSVAALMRGEEVPEGGYRGAYITELARELQGEGVPADPLDGVTEAAYARMLWWIKDTVAALGVDFDVWFSERTLHDSGAIDAVVARLEAAGHAYRAEDAVWLRTTAFGDDKDRVLIRGDGRPTYFAADCAYMASKFDRGAEHAVYLLGADHHGYVGRLQAIADAEGIGRERVEIIIGQLVNLYRGGEAVRMSKRTGEMVVLSELLSEVGADAARYTFLRYSLDVTIDFDIAEVVRQDRENPVYYVQYSCARIAGIMRTAQQRGVEPGAVVDADLSLLRHDAEEELIRRIATFPETVAYAAAERAPHKIARYAEELAAAFHVFYTECQVVSDDVALTRARYQLCVAARSSLANALHLLGVSAPERM